MNADVVIDPFDENVTREKTMAVALEQEFGQFVPLVKAYFAERTAVLLPEASKKGSKQRLRLPQHSNIDLCRVVRRRKQCIENGFKRFVGLLRNSGKAEQSIVDLRIELRANQRQEFIPNLISRERFGDVRGIRPVRLAEVLQEAKQFVAENIEQRADQGNGGTQRVNLRHSGQTGNELWPELCKAWMKNNGFL